MRKLTILSIITASLLLIGCGGETKDAPKEGTSAPEKSAIDKATEAAKKAVDKTVEVAKDAGKKAEAVAEEATNKAKDMKDAVVKKAEEVKKAMTGGNAVNTKICEGCHGANFEKKAMNVSKIVKDMSKEDIVKALKGYKDGSYGGNMKGLMKSQLASFDDAKIEAVANQIAGK